MRPKECAVQNGELDPCCRQEKLGEMLPGHRSDRMAKALWDYSMVEKHETSEHARLVVVQDPRDTVKAGLPESQSPEGAIAHLPEKTPETGTGPCGRVTTNLSQSSGALERCPVRVLKETNGTPKSR